MCCLSDVTETTIVEDNFPSFSRTHYSRKYLDMKFTHRILKTSKSRKCFLIYLLMCKGILKLLTVESERWILIKQACGLGIADAFTTPFFVDFTTGWKIRLKYRQSWRRPGERREYLNTDNTEQRGRERRVLKFILLPDVLFEWPLKTFASRKFHEKWNFSTSDSFYKFRGEGCRYQQKLILRERTFDIEEKCGENQNFHGFSVEINC